MNPPFDDVVGKRVFLEPQRTHGTIRGVVEGDVFAIEFEVQVYGGIPCHYRGRAYVPSRNGAWIKARACTLVPDDPFHKSVHEYTQKELAR